ncbi:MAG TPA: metalloregulator ArsR/SmtB family transcription factor [Streptosporangiaceae bacterium]|nr:metalloregulator ArsR/SmtB family transcription factor [Streptosporangiaceae bacterium]
MRDIQKVLQALTSPIRREILTLIWDRDVPAGEIAAAFAVTKPTISQHLAALRQAGLVTMTAVGTSRRYRARQDVLQGLHAALDGSAKWVPADDLPERALAQVHTRPAVVAWIDVDTDQAVTFEAFTDPAFYSRWLGVPVAIDDGRFACTMEWGTEIRGRYEVVCPPEMIVMNWDFEDEAVPVPGAQLTGYLRIKPRQGGGAHVEVHQLVGSDRQATFMEGAWAMVLGRLKAGVVAAADAAGTAVTRAPRRKRRTAS